MNFKEVMPFGSAALRPRRLACTPVTIIIVEISLVVPTRYPVFMHHRASALARELP